MKDVIVEAYVVYGMNVFEYEDTEKERIHENQSDETALDQTEGYNRKKYHKEEERRTMTLGVYSGVSADDEFAFGDEEVAAVE